MGGFWALSVFLGFGQFGFALVQEKGHGSASDMVRRKIERQNSESDVGMFDIFLIYIPMAAIVVLHPKLCNPITRICIFILGLSRRRRRKSVVVSDGGR